MVAYRMWIAKLFVPIHLLRIRLETGFPARQASLDLSVSTLVENALPVIALLVNALPVMALPVNALLCLLYTSPSPRDRG